MAIVEERAVSSGTLISSKISEKVQNPVVPDRVKIIGENIPKEELPIGEEQIAGIDTTIRQHRKLCRACRTPRVPESRVSHDVGNKARTINAFKILKYGLHCSEFTIEIIKRQAPWKIGICQHIHIDNRIGKFPCPQIVRSKIRHKSAASSYTLNHRLTGLDVSSQSVRPVFRIEGHPYVHPAFLIPGGPCGQEICVVAIRAERGNDVVSVVDFDKITNSRMKGRLTAENVYLGNALITQYGYQFLIVCRGNILQTPHFPVETKDTRQLAMQCRIELNICGTFCWKLISCFR